MVKNDYGNSALLRGTVGGIGAFLATYLVVFLWKGTAIAAATVGGESPLSGTALAGVPTDLAAWKGAGLVTYGAHLVPIVKRGLGAGASGNPVLVAGGEYLLLLAVPPVCIALAGHWVATTTGVAGLGTGASVVVGYFPATILGTIPFTLTGVGGTLGPDRFTALFVGAIGYPLVFGAAGGLVAVELERRRSSDGNDATLGGNRGGDPRGDGRRG